MICFEQTIMSCNRCHVANSLSTGRNTDHFLYTLVPRDVVSLILPVKQKSKHWRIIRLLRSCKFVACPQSFERWLMMWLQHDSISSTQSFDRTPTLQFTTVSFTCSSAGRLITGVALGSDPPPPRAFAFAFFFGCAFSLLLCPRLACEVLPHVTTLPVIVVNNLDASGRLTRESKIHVSSALSSRRGT